MALPRKALAVGAALALVLAVFLGWQWWGHRQTGPLTLYGNVDIRQVDLGFRVDGRIAAVLVDEGHSVAPGEPLARLETDVLVQQREQAAAALAQQEAALTRLEHGYRLEEIAQARAAVSAAHAVAENAAINQKRVTALRAANATSQKDLDNARARAREAQARLRSSQDQLDMLLSGYREEDVLAQKAAAAAARAALNHAEIRLRDAVLAAPQQGIILARAREAGAIVQAGQTVYTLALTDPVWLRAYVDEPHLGRVKPGMAVKIYVDAAPGRSFSGRVGFISPTAEFTPKTVETSEVRTALVYRLRVQAQDPENIMRQGMPVTMVLEEDPTP